MSPRWIAQPACRPSQVAHKAELRRGARSLPAYIVYTSGNAPTPCFTGDFRERHVCTTACALFPRTLSGPMNPIVVKHYWTASRSKVLRIEIVVDPGPRSLTLLLVAEQSQDKTSISVSWRAARENAARDTSTGNLRVNRRLFLRLLDCRIRIIVGNDVQQTLVKRVVRVLGPQVRAMAECKGPLAFDLLPSCSRSQPTLVLLTCSRMHAAHQRCGSRREKM